MEHLFSTPAGKYIKIGVGVAVGLVIVTVAYLLFPKSYISMAIAPQQMNLSVDGGTPHSISRGKTKFVIAGTHRYTFSRDGFTTETVTLTSGNNETKELLFVLTPETDAARAILEGENDESHAIQERYGSVKEAAYTAKINKDYPIIKDLPIVLHSITIRICSSQKYPKDKSKLALCVDSDDPQRAAILAGPVLKKKGYDITQYEVIYTDPSGGAKTIGNPGEG